MSPSETDVRRTLRRLPPLAAAALLLLPTAAIGQGALDPSVAPRAVQLSRQGQRDLATQMLGRYLATAPHDGVSWMHLGHFYLLDAQAWHAGGHQGTPAGPLVLEFAAAALDQAELLLVDSAIVYRGMVAMDRALLFVEDSGWDAARERRPRHDVPRMPDFLVELGANLLSSCPTGGVLATGSDLETLAVWYVSLETGRRSDVLPLTPSRYSTDGRYRAQIARELGVDSSFSIQQALTAVAERRPVCLSPMSDRSAAPATSWTPVRLVMVSGTAASPTGDFLTVTDLIRVERAGGAAWAPEVRAVYEAAARRNIHLCGGLLSLLGDPPPGTCGR